MIEAAPLPGVGLPIEKVPAPVQTATSDEIERRKALDLSSFLTRRFNAVFANEIQNNPFQPDINYRGYTASPLLGTPQGLSVYMDGVRLNQPFGDVVSWDLIPRLAISTTTLRPGAKPRVPFTPALAQAGVRALVEAASYQEQEARSIETLDGMLTRARIWAGVDGEPMLYATLTDMLREDP